MKSLVIYFSQTGNTKKIGQAIAEGITSRTGQCDVKRLQDVKGEDWLDYDLIGIGSCTWSSCPNTRLIWHIRELPEAVRGKHAFFYLTHGCTPGRALARGVKPLQEKGLVVLGWKSWYCQASLPGHFKPWFTDGHPDEHDLDAAFAFGRAMAEHSERVKKGHPECVPKLPSDQTFDELYGVGHPFLFKEPPPRMNEGKDIPEDERQEYILEWPTTMDYVCQLEGVPNIEGYHEGNFRIDPDKCIRCHRCVEACWCGNIDGSTEVPSFRSMLCEMCLFCEGVCPTGALEFTFRPPMTEEAAAVQRENGGGDLAGQLYLAEAMGLFRRYVELEDIGYTTPWEVATTHPRHKEIP